MCVTDFAVGSGVAWKQRTAWTEGSREGFVIKIYSPVLGSPRPHSGLMIPRRTHGTQKICYIHVLQLQ